MKFRDVLRINPNRCPSLLGVIIISTMDFLGVRMRILEDVINMPVVVNDSVLFEWLSYFFEHFLKVSHFKLIKRVLHISL